MVFHLGDDDLVTSVQMGAAIAVHDQIECLGGIMGDGDILAARRVQEGCCLVAHRFILLGRALAQRMHAAMDVGIVMLKQTRHGIDHLSRLLRTGTIIEIGEGVAVYFLRQCREIGTDCLNIKGVGTVAGNGRGSIWHVGFQGWIGHRLRNRLRMISMNFS